MGADTGKHDHVVVPADDLADLAARVLAATGCAAEEATRIAQRLVRADLRGHGSHGIGRVPRYVQMMRDGVVSPGRHISVVEEGGSFRVLDGNGGFGQTVGEEATKAGCDLAEQAGVAVIALRNSGHLGCIGDWALLAADRGLISIHFVNVRGRSLVAPFGGRDRRMGTTPFCVGVPRAQEKPVVLDFATSFVAEGKAFVAAKGGAPLPMGALIDELGEPSNDPEDLYGETIDDLVPNASIGSGALAPFGGHKGSGLNFVIDLLAGALTGSGVSRTLRDGPPAPLRNGMLSIYLDPARFAGSAYVHDQVEDYVAYVKSARPVKGTAEVLIPGEIEDQKLEQRLKDGVPFPATSWDDLTGLARSLQIREIPTLA